jgi:hypothetical protein
LRVDGRTRWRLRVLGLDRVEFWDAVRTRSTARGLSMAAMVVDGVYERTHPCRSM